MHLRPPLLPCACPRYAATSLLRAQWLSSCIAEERTSQGEQVIYYTGSLRKLTMEYSSQGILMWLVFYFVNTGAILALVTTN